MNYDGFDRPSLWDFARAVVIMLAWMLAFILTPVLVIGAFYFGLKQ